jgi:Raf kinase inhibitor-like YbhB/YbcL family protein
MYLKILISLFHFLLFQDSFTVKSPDFANNHYMQFKFTCDGANISPGLVFENIPKGTTCFALIMDDTDVSGSEFVHWVMWDIPLCDRLLENKASGVFGKNSHNQNAYFGPCQPNGEHNYHFKVFALDRFLKLNSSAGKTELLKTMETHILGQSELVAKYIRQ